MKRKLWLKELKKREEEFERTKIAFERLPTEKSSLSREKTAERIYKYESLHESLCASLCKDSPLVPHKKPKEKPAPQKFIYAFEEGSADMIGLLGGKGAHLAEMTRLGINVPPGFIITTQAFREYYENGLTSDLREKITAAMKELEVKTQRSFGGIEKPLLVSVRSGAPVSMPGMMETILNIGMTPKVIEALIKETGQPAFVYDIYTRFLNMQGKTVYGRSIKYDIETFFSENDFIFQSEKRRKGHLMEFIDRLAWRVSYDFAKTLNDPFQELYTAIETVFKSWNRHKAVQYREIQNIPDNIGTAVTVQAMVFGNRTKKSFTGVAFSRNTDNGKKGMTGEVLFNAQGEDVVAGTATPLPIKQLKEQEPKLYAALEHQITTLERHYADIQDIEFTSEDGTLYLLQTRTAKRAAQANLTTTMDFLEEGMITPEQAIARVSPDDIRTILNATLIDPSKEYVLLGKGEPSGGVVTGKIALTSKQAEKYRSEGALAILVRTNTDTEDIVGIKASAGILAVTGGSTSHAAVVARGMGKTCITGCDTLDVDEDRGIIHFKKGETNIELHEGDTLSLDGNNGVVYKDAVDVMRAKELPAVGKLEALLLSKMKNDIIVDIASNTDPIHKNTTAYGVFQNVAWFVIGENLRRIQQYTQGSQKSMRRLEESLEEQYATIFNTTTEPMICSILPQGITPFITINKKETEKYEAFFSSTEKFLAPKTIKTVRSMIVVPEQKKQQALEQGLYRGQINAIVRAAQQSHATVSVNIPATVIQRQGNDIVSFVQTQLERSKRNSGYTEQIQISRAKEEQTLVYRPGMFLFDALTYVKR